jgi:hypothetical protein
MAETPSSTRRRSWWIRFIEGFLLYIGGRAILFAGLAEKDPTYRMAMEAGFGPQLITVQLLFGVLAWATAAAVHLRYERAFLMTLGVMALYTALTIATLMQTTSNLPAAREAYRASREARGLPITDDRLDRLFSPDAVPMLWITAALLCVPPLLILVWRKHELEPEPVEDPPRPRLR